MGKPIYENDASFFRTLALILDARKRAEKGREWEAVAKLTRRQLGIASGSGRGRKSTRYDFSAAMPRAVIVVTLKRIPTHAEPGTFTDTPISRDELRRAIQTEQQRAGLETQSKLKEPELSRLIKTAKITKFMERR